MNIYFVILDGSTGNSTTLYHASRENVDETFGTPVEVELKENPEGFSSKPSFSRDLNQLFIFNTRSAIHKEIL